MAYVDGFRVVGHLETSEVFRQLDIDVRAAVEAATPLLGGEAQKRLALLKKSKPPKEAERIWQATEEEQAKGWLGPFLSEQELDEIHGIGAWGFMPRFLLQQLLKDRLIDDAARGGQNEAAIHTETIFTVSVDWVAEVLAAIHAELERRGLLVDGRLPDWCSPGIALDDLPDAFRGMAIHREDAHKCHVAVWSPVDRVWRFAESRAMMFGLAPAVVAFNRLPTLGVAVARRIFATAAAAYFDDVATISCASGSGTEQRATQSVLELVGAPSALAKRFGDAQLRVWLGVCINLARVPSEGLVEMQPKTGLKEKLAEELETHTDGKPLSKSIASKVRGKAVWAGGLTFGRLARLGLRVLKEKQYHGPPEVSEDDAAELRFLAMLLRRLPPYTVRVDGRRARGHVLYTDASLEEDGILRAGWVCFTKDGRRPQGSTLTIAPEIVETWVPRKTQIFQGEAFAVYAAIWNLREELRGSDILAFVDNEGAASALIRGTSSQTDVGAVVHAVHWLLFSLGARLWVEWIDSDSNPSDGLSRDGLLDEWTQAQGWLLSEGRQPPWSQRFDVHKEICSETLG